MKVPDWLYPFFLTPNRPSFDAHAVWEKRCVQLKGRLSSPTKKTTETQALTASQPVQQGGTRPGEGVGRFPMVTAAMEIMSSLGFSGSESGFNHRFMKEKKGRTGQVLKGPKWDGWRMSTGTKVEETSKDSPGGPWHGSKSAPRGLGAMILCFLDLDRHRWLFWSPCRISALPCASSCNGSHRAYEISMTT